MQARTRRRSPMLGVLILGVVGMTGACGQTEPNSTSPSSDLCPSAGDCESTECSATIEKPCWRYHPQLVGDLMNAALRAKYIAAFGDACYVSEANTFDCWYRTWQKACEDAVLIGKVSGNAAYDKGYKCQPDGVGNYWLQIGSDVSNRTWIFFDKAPRQTPLIEVNGVPTAVNGPYRNLPEPQVLGPGERFYNDIVDKNGNKIEQRELILQVNRDAHKNDAGVGEIHSDLAGFVYPCDKTDPSKMCTEPTILKEGDQYDPEAPEVHHVVRRKDLRCCPWGTNSSANAVVISRQLNQYFHNKYPSADEVTLVNNVPAYTP